MAETFERILKPMSLVQGRQTLEYGSVELEELVLAGALHLFSVRQNNLLVLRSLSPLRWDQVMTLRGRSRTGPGTGKASQLLQ